jgi:hypothetical protein
VDTNVFAGDLCAPLHGMQNGFDNIPEIVSGWLYDSLLKQKCEFASGHWTAPLELEVKQDPLYLVST